MILLRANAGLKVVFVKLINTMGRNFAWNDIFIIRNNNLVLAGSDGVMIFDFGNKAVSINTAEVNLKEDSIVQVTKNELLENVLNMTLYAFGKWGKIKGLTVERDYPQINTLFGNILKEIGIEPMLTAENLRLYRNDIQITYEDMIQLILEQQEKQEQMIDGQAGEALPEKSTQDKGRYDIGLWHKILWKGIRYTFETEELSVDEKIKARIGNNFYKVGCKCPICGEKLSMVIYPEGEELLIETDEKGVYLARVYTCQSCHRFFTPKPHLLITEGSVYTLDFEDDNEAYGDYLEIIGKLGARTYNCNYNVYEAEYRQNKSKTETQLEEICEDIALLSDEEVNNLKEKMDSGFYPSKSVERCQRTVVKEIKRRESPAKETDKAEKIKVKREQGEQTVANPGTARHAAKRARGLRKAKGLRIVKGLRIAKTMGDKDNLWTLSRYQEKMTSTDNHAAMKQERNHLGTDAGGNIRAENRKYWKKNASRPQEESSGDKLTDFNAFEEATRNSSEVIEGEEIYLDPYHDKESRWKKRAEDCKDKDYNTILRVIGEIDQEDINKETREALLLPLKKLLETRGRKELAFLRQEIPEHISKKQYQLIKERIAQYTMVDHKSEMDYLERKREEGEKLEITAFIKKANARDRGTFLQLLQNLKKEGFEEKNVAPFLETIHNKIYDMDEETIKKICGDLTELTYERGLRAYEEIEKRELLPELKTKTLARIDKRLTAIKMNECEQLVNKLSKDLNKFLKGPSRIHFYNVRKSALNEGEEDTVIRRALNTFAAGRGKYEYPIVICDASRKGNGGRGFVLTPDHIFYNTLTESGILDIMKVEKITTRSGRILYADIGDSGRIKLSNSMKLSDVKGFLKIMNEFVSYLKEKPESRDIAYIAKEKHSVKCCYRCGHFYRGDNLCPKCGAKYNE